MDQVIRLTFRYHGGKFVPVAARRVRMIAPDPFGHLELEEGRAMPSGRYAELRDGDGAVLRRVAMTESMTTAEFPTGEPEQPFARTQLAEGMIVSAVIPADDRAAEGALVEVVAQEGPAGLIETAQRDLAVISLAREDRP